MKLTSQFLLQATLASIVSFSIAGMAQSPHTLTPTEQQRVNDLVKKMTLEQKLDYIGGTGFAVRPMPSLGIPALEMSDGPYGTRSNVGFPSTTYAAGIGLAASWDPELAAEVGGGIGRDARARGVHFMLGPGVNIYRSPRNGRNFEYFGEDPFLASSIAVGYITGMQQQGVSSTVKHFLANNSEFLRHDSNSVVDERTLREIYLPAFEASVKEAHVGAMMDSYNLINGVHATQNSTFNIDLVRNEWKFPGIMMSDWDATYDGVAAANNGLDLEMPTGEFMNRANLMAAVKSGKVSEATIDEKVEHILSTAESFGWLDRDQTDEAISFYDAHNNEVALKSARESAVLLKNEDHLLPLDKATLKTILVVGPDAYPGVPVGGGSAGVVPFHLVSDVEGLSRELGPNVNVLYDRGIPKLSVLAHATDFTTTADGKTAGVTLETFGNDELAGSPVSTAVVKHISLAGVTIASLVANMDQFMDSFSLSAVHKASHRETGYFNAPAAGHYLLIVEGSGEGSGNRVSVDGKMVVDNWKLQRAFQPWVSLDLGAGPHKIVAEDSQSGIFGGHLVVAIVSPDKLVDPRAVAMAKNADVVVVAAGYSQESESEGGDRTFSLPYGQDELINAMAAANKKTVVDITSGGNVDSSAWLDHVPALLESWYAGQEGGTALAEILLGEVNPSGHLPATFELKADDNPTYANYYPAAGSIDVVYKEGVFVGYRGYEKNNVKPLYPFGFGLSYTTFKFSHMAVTPQFDGQDPMVVVTFDVSNTGGRAGAEVAQVYVSDDHAPVARPEKELKAFQRVQLAPGETKHVSVKLNMRSFAYYDVAGKKWTVAPGKFTIHAGDSVESLPLTGSVEISKAVAGETF